MVDVLDLPYAGAVVGQTFRERWLNSVQIGDIAPCGMVEVRRGRYVRSYHPYDSFGYPTFGDYPGAIGTGFWYPDWQVDSDWMTLDAVLDIKLDQSFDQNGVTTLTLQMDNKALVPTTGAADILYHLVEDGYYSPLRGYVAPGRPNPSVAQTPYYNFLPNAQIRVWQGYGQDTLLVTFLGLIDDIETDTGQENQLTITARDHGGVLVDEKFFGWAMEKAITAPLTFAPRNLAEQSRLNGGAANALTTLPGYPASNVTDDNAASDWVSEPQTDIDSMQWIEINLPAGKYSNFILSTPLDNLHAYVGIQPTPYQDDQGNWTNPNVNGVDISHQLDANGWWNPLGRDVPHGGWPYFEEIPSTVSGSARWYSFDGVFQFGNATTVRIGFQNLQKISSLGPGYYASVTRFLCNQRAFNQNAIAGKFVIIDDVADIVRCVLRWCGFKGWEVEDTGTNLLEPYVCDQSVAFMDMINTVKDMVGYTFFIGEPLDPDDDQDLGYPIFRNNRVMEDSTAPTEFIDDQLLLTAAKVKLSNADDHCIIRCRGIAKNDGVPLGGDSVDRIMFAYIPQWAGEQAAKQAGVLKPVTHTDELFTTIDDCEFGCYLIALQIALLKYTAIIDLPGNPGIGLDTLQSVIDRTQGLNSRFYVTNRTSEMKFGNDGYFTLELGGSLVDTPDLVSVLSDYKAAIKRIDRGQRNPWLRKRKGTYLAYGYQDK